MRTLFNQDSPHRFATRHHRKGITLLFVISMIVLFLLMGATFVVITNDYNTSAVRRGRLRLQRDSGTALLNRAFYDFIRGPALTNVSSPLRGQSLLADQYGYGLKGMVEEISFVPGSNQQLIAVRLRPYFSAQERQVALNWFGTNLDTNPGLWTSLASWNNTTDWLTSIRKPFNPDPNNDGDYSDADFTDNKVEMVNYPGYFAGQVLTFVNQNDGGVSCRIVDYRIEPAAMPADWKRHFIIAPDWNSDENFALNLAANAGNAAAAQTELDALLDTNVVINGRAFTGYGAGVIVDANGDLHPTNHELNEQAVYPNYRSLVPPLSTQNVADLFFEEYLTHDQSVNESYDAADFNNMHLAHYNDVDGNGNVTQAEMIASFHRREFHGVSFAFAGGAYVDNRISFRPIYADRNGDGIPDAHSTANANFPNIIEESIANSHGSRQLDVDNDLDGVMDSIWMDIGLPFQSDSSGRVIKPLVAPLIIDLDGRFNLNAHGGLADLDAVNYMTRQDLLGTLMAGGTPGTITGLGLGPAEVSLHGLLGNTEYQRVLLGDGGNVDGRYGLNARVGNPGREYASDVDFAGYPAGSISGVDNSGALGGLFNSAPMDIHGRYALGFAHANREADFSTPVGMPVVDVLTSSWATTYGSEIADAPYEKQLLQTARYNTDSLFMPVELERVLRNNDRDSVMLPDRLEYLLSNGATFPQQDRRTVTTESYEVPMTPIREQFAPPRGMQPHRIPDRLYQILSISFPDHARIVQEIELMLAPEVIRGLPMNLNRRFGDGIDQNGNGIVDEAWLGGDPTLNDGGTENVVYENTTGTATVGMDHDNNGTAGDALARQVFARQLFVLAWLAGGEYGGASVTVPSAPDMNRDGVYNSDDIDALAQWVVNVVDFMDPDSIMTRFDYDRNPFDGWDLTAGRSLGRVYGFERPELLITESMATHDRNSEDLPADGGTISGGDNNSDFDSRMVPTASVFVELYNPNLTSNNTQLLPEDIYVGNPGVDLAAYANDGVTPVWRLAFTETREQDPRTNGRRVYFTSPDVNVEPVGNTFYYPDAAISTAMGTVAPNGYAVVGSGGIQHGGNNYRTTFGRRTDAIVDYAVPGNTDLRVDETRAITLIPGTGIEIRDGFTDPLSVTTANCVAVPIDRWEDGTGGAGINRSLGLSDPDAGYPAEVGVNATEFDPDGTAGNGDGDGQIFDSTLPRPADDLTMHIPEVATEGNHPTFRFVQLQRLANPLAPYNQQTNPYITVDFAPVDLIVFNGNGDEAAIQPGNETDFRSLERGQLASGGGDVTRNLWSPLTIGFLPTASNELGGADMHHFSAKMTESFAGINMAFVDHEYNDASLPTPKYQTDPLPVPDTTVSEDLAFSWLTWNNRPYVSEYELSSVPRGGGVADMTGTVLIPDNEGGTSALDPPRNFRGPANMLENYTLPGDSNRTSFHLAFTAEGTQGAFEMNGGTNVNMSAQGAMHRLFKFLEVPSRFVGTDMILDATTFSGQAPGDFAAYNPPHHRIPHYRNPGKININTISDPRVWDALMGTKTGIVTGFQNTTFDDLRTSRAGKGMDSIQNPTYPNYFANPFRPKEHSSFVPDGMIEDQAMHDGAGLLRSHPTDPRRLFEYESTNLYDSTSRNQYFANMPTIRIPNMATTRSSVYAIWLTVGFFEVDENGLLGREVGWDTGDSVRHRAFYIYDRSIPVAFEPGKNHNVERAILVKSIIE